MPDPRRHADAAAARRARGRAVGYCLRLTGQDRRHAEDVVQETLLRAWRHRDRARPVAGGGPGLAVHGRAQHRDRRVAHRRVQASAGRRAARRGRDDDRTDQLLLSWVVAEALTRLSPEHRAVLLECYYRGRPVAEAARRLGVPEGTVKSRTHYALRALQAGAGGDGGGRMSCEFAHDDGAYVLGALSPAERLAFERHLAAAPSAPARSELAGLPGLLGRVARRSWSRRPTSRCRTRCCPRWSGRCAAAGAAARWATVGLAPRPRRWSWPPCRSGSRQHGDDARRRPRHPSRAQPPSTAVGRGRWSRSARSRCGPPSTWSRSRGAPGST